MAQQFQILLEIYRRPHAAFCRVLDEGKFLFALIAAAGSALLFFGIVYRALLVEAFQAAETYSLANPSDLLPLMRLLGGYSTLSSLIILAAAYVPSAIAVVALWDSLGGVATVLRRDYLPVLTCHLLSCAAVFLPLVLLRIGLNIGMVLMLPLMLAGALYFLFLSATSLRAVMGTSTGHAFVATVAASGAALGGYFLYGLLGSFAYYLTSPFLLYYAYRYFQGDIQMIGSGLSSRQSLRRQLEIAKINPRDSDAHFQIGLIQEERRQYAEAEASFSKAIEIAPDEADYHFHLAKVAREQGHLDTALIAARTGASLNEKVSSSEVLRELGAAALLSGHAEEARQALDKYVQRRPYDPEGLSWYGKALKNLGQTAAAKEAFEQAVEAARTAPPHQRGKVGKWASEAKAELKSL